MAAATSAATLTVDLLQFHLTNEIIRTATLAHKSHAEVGNIVERWLMSSANSNGPHACVYLHMSLDIGAAANQKMAAEIAEKKLASPQAATRLVQRLLNMVGARRADLQAAMQSDPAQSVVVAHCDGSLRCQLEQIEFCQPLTAATEALVRIGGCTAAVAAALRYAALAPGGQQWGLPRAHVQFLYDSFGVRNEAFASPLNSRLLGLPGARFCSLFPDTDGVFGSIGDFFAADMAALPGNWVVNPPFVEALLERAARKCIEAVEAARAAGGALTVFFVAPDWRDAEFHRLLKEAATASVRLTPGRYFYESPAGDRIPTRAASAYFALCADGAGADGACAGADGAIRALHQIYDV
jgi:hypothetical protein